ncbi:MAG: gfo/Idh/MocA family oxidoreductase [Microbacteriaceae bacterium]|nr:gfo/Idh/MocA family oxidoreductase [Microbacteriaceae bacterium]
MTMSEAQSAQSQADPTRFRVGVVGLGYAGSTHMKAFSKHPKTVLVAIAGKEVDRLESLSAEFNVATTASDWQDLVADPNIDIISIATPNSLHHPIAVAALKAGKHVFCEKPLSITAEQAQEMVAAASANNRILEVAFNYRRRQDIGMAQNLVASGKLGRVYHSRVSWKRRAGIPGLKSWFTSAELAGGGAAIDLGPHIVDSLLYMLGEPKVTAVSAVMHGELGRAGYGGMDSAMQMAGSTGLFEVEDLCSAIMRLDDGSSVAFEITWASHAVDDEDISFELLGVDSGLRIFIPRYATEDTITLFGDEDGEHYVRKPKITSTGEGHLAVLNEFIEHVVSGEFALYTGEYALHRTNIIDALYRSAKAGKEVTVS